MLFNSDVSLYELMSEIHRLLDEKDKKNRYQDWMLAIPSVKNLEQVNFLFTKLDKCCQSFLTPVILKLQRDEINQSLYYAASLVGQQDIIAINDESYDNKCAESPEATINQLIEVCGSNNIKKIWAIEVRNSLKAKHYVILLKNDDIYVLVS